MSTFGEYVGPFVTGLIGIGPAGWISALVATVLFLAGRAYANRKRLSYQEVYNSKVGIVPPFSSHPDGDITAFNNVTILVIHVWNSGRAAIAKRDFGTLMRVTVTGRHIIDFRVSGATPAQNSIELGIDTGVLDDEGRRTGWIVTATTPDIGNLTRSLTRRELRADLRRSLKDTDAGGLSAADMDQRRQLVVPPLDLPRNAEFRLVIGCRADQLSRDLAEHAPSPGFSVDVTLGRPRAHPRLFGSRAIDRNAKASRFSLTRVLSTLITIFAVLLVVSLVYPRNTAPDFCAAGTLRVVGSSAFAPEVATIGQGYTRDCTDARLNQTGGGSLEGIREVQDAPPDARPLTVAFSDGAAVIPAPQLHRQAVAVLIFAVVVDPKAKVPGLSSAQIREIYAGKHTNWSDYGGADLPIRLVGRGSDSGSRQAFERYVLAGAEPPVSSNNCKERDRVPTAPLVRCERASTTEMLDAVAQTDGAIGYADAAAAATRNPGLLRLRVDGFEPTRETVAQGYPFWTVEFAYTNGVPPTAGLLEKFTSYLSSDAAARRLGEAGYVPCVRADRSIEPLCAGDR